MALHRIEALARTLGALAALGTLAYAVVAMLRAARRPADIEEPGAARLLRPGLLLIETLAFIAAGVLLWRPIPVRLPDSLRAVMLVVGSVLLFGGLSLYLAGMERLGSAFAPLQWVRRSSPAWFPRLPWGRSSARLESAEHDNRASGYINLEAGDGGTAMSEHENRATLEALVAALNASDLDALDRVFADDIVMEWPQSGERIVGGQNRREVYSRFPSLPHVTPRRMTGCDDLWTLEASLDYGDGDPYMCVFIFEMRDGLIAKEAGYWSKPFPAPDWRAPWVETIG